MDQGKLPARIRMMVMAVAVMGAIFCLAPSKAHALASFARQTGLSCSACHLTFPELTPTGRDFKLNGFTTSGDDKVITEDAANKTAALSVLDDVPLSISFQTSVTATNTSQTGAQNPSIEFPQQINFWLAGENHTPFRDLHPTDLHRWNRHFQRRQQRYPLCRCQDRTGRQELRLGHRCKQQPHDRGPVEYHPGFQLSLRQPGRGFHARGDNRH